MGLHQSAGARRFQRAAWSLAPLPKASSPLALTRCAQLCLTLCGPMDFSRPGSSVHGIFQARILEWVAISFSRRSSQPRDRTLPLMSPVLAGGFSTLSPPGEVLLKREAGGHPVRRKRGPYKEHRLFNPDFTEQLTSKRWKLNWKKLSYLEVTRLVSFSIISETGVSSLNPFKQETKLNSNMKT